jgi:hypothetical protein
VTKRKGIAANKQQRNASQDLGMPVGPAMRLRKCSQALATFSGITCLSRQILSMAAGSAKSHWPGRTVRRLSPDGPYHKDLLVFVSTPALRPAKTPRQPVDQ